MEGIPFGKPMIEVEECDAVMDALKHPILTHGPRVRQFETDFSTWTKAPEAISVSSCTAGMHLVWFTLGIGPGDEVIVPAMTHTATAHAVSYTGATPIFVDSENATGNVCLDAVASAITERTKAIAVVHYLGLPIDMKRLMRIAEKHDLFVLEDCALSLGAQLDGIHVGLQGDVGVFSFYPVKHMTTAEGGMVVTRHTDLADRLRLRKAFGVDRAMHERKIPGIYDVVTLGYNFRMNEIQAAIGIEQIKKLNRFLDQRKKNFQALQNGFASIQDLILFVKPPTRFHNSHYCFNIMLPREHAGARTDFINALKEKNIGTSVHYPGPVPQTTYYKKRFEHKQSDHPVANWISNCSIALPVGPHLDNHHMETIITAVKNTVREILH